MTDAFPGPPADDGAGRTPGPRTPDAGVRYAQEGADSWLRTRRRGRAPSQLPLHVEDAYIVGHGALGPVGGLVRFRGPDFGEVGRRHRAWWSRGTDLERRLSASSGELRMIRDRRAAGPRPALMAMLTLNGITDRAVPLRLSLFGPLPPDEGGADAEREVPTAVVGIDVRLSASAWRLPLPAYARCHVHLEGVMRMLPEWPLPR